jgi:PAS domain S-box-containing protein
MRKIQNKILVMFLMVIIIPIVIVCSYSTIHLTKLLKQNIITELHQNNKIKSERSMSFLNSIKGDIIGLSGNVSLINLIDAISGNKTDQINQCRSNLEFMLKKFSESKGIYNQIFYIDESGMERVQVDLLHKGYSEIASNKKFQNMSDISYFNETVKLKQGKVYVSEVYQKSENGVSVSHYKPMLRYSTPVFDNKKEKKGILVFNVGADNLLENISSYRLVKGLESILLDKNGNYLLQSDISGQWDEFSDINSENNLIKDVSLDLLKIVLSGESGIKMTDDAFLSFIPIKFDASNSRRYWVFIESLDKSILFSQIFTLYKMIGALVFLLLTGVVIATLTFSKKLTKPLNELVKGATAVAKGDLDNYINVKSNDELELLTFSFNKMVSSLGKARKQLQNYTHNLEQKVADKTLIVNEKLKKSEALVEAGQLLWNEEDINKTIDLIANLISKTLNVKFVGMQLLDKTKILLCMVSGVGWNEGVVGNATVDVGLDSHMSYNLNELKPVIIKDLSRDSGFLAYPLLLEHGIVSGVSVPMIVGEHVIGVLGVYSDQFTEFSNDDTNFLQSVGYIIAAAIESRRADKEIENKNEYTNNLIGTAQDAIICIDEKGVINIWNKSAEKIFGYPESEIIGQPITKIIPDRYKKQHEEGLQSFLKSGEFRVAGKTIEVHGINKKGVEVPIEMSLTVQKIEKEKTLFTAIIRDLTERKKMEGALLQSEKLKSIGTMTAGISHEFNNILAIISGNVQLLELKYKDHGKLTEGLRTITNATKDGVKISNRMLKFAKKEKNTTGFILIEINDLITQSIDFTMPRWKNMSQIVGISYHVDKEGIKPVPLVLCNPTEIREVFVNIINNALDAMPDGGCISFSSWRKDDNVFVSIKDTGVGMPDHILKNIFDPFFTTKIASGTGLGMSTSYGIMSRHGGMINVESQVGKGSTFTLQFPIATSTVSSEAPSYPILETKSNDLSILVVDDEVEICSMLDEFLTTGGYKVKTVDNGAMAIDITKRERFDLVLCDMAMPKICGQEVIRALNELSNRPKIGVITGWDNDLKLTENEDLIVDFIIKKPFNFTELTRHLNNIECAA